MKDTEKTREQLIEELEELRERNRRLELSEIERIQKEELLKESEKKYRMLVESSTDMLFTVDLKGNFLFVNRAFQQCLGYTKEQIMRINGFALVHPDDMELVRKQFAQIIAGKTADNMEYRYKTKDGKYIHILNNAAPISDSQGNIVAALGIARDIRYRKKIEEELRKARDKLGERVVERTAQLLAANKKLSEEIKERRRIEKELRKSEEKYRAIFESFHDVYYQTDKEGLITIISPSVRTQAGYDPEDVIGNPVTDFYLNPDDQEKFMQELKETGTVNDYELKLKAKDGRVIEVSTSSKLVFGKDGKPVGVEGVLRDITKRKQAEIALKESEEKYRDLVENLAEVIYTLDQSGRLTFVSPAVKSLIGYSPEELESKTFSEWIHQEDLLRAREGFQKVLSGKSMTNEYRIISKNGEVRWIYTSSRPVLDEDRVAGVQGVLTDITERKRAEEALQAREAYLDQLFESAQEAIVMSDSDGKALRINEEFTRVFGYTKEEAAGRRVDELIVPENLQQEALSITRSVSKGEKIAMETVRCHKDGTPIDVSVLASPIIINGELAGTFGIYRDITRRKQDEEQIRASLKEKEILLQEINHRVKNNMQIISSLLNLQSRHIEDKKALELFQSSQNRVKSMALIHERLYQSKDFTRVDVADYVRSLTNQLFITYGIDQSAIKLKVDIKDIFLDMNTAIPCGLIINELVSNSLEHAFPRGAQGEIKITMHPLNKNEIELIVSDSGVGMPEGRELKNTQSLGLYLVSMLAEDQLHGEIKLDRKKGTAFHFRLRVKK
ncbi:MAG: PAS domain S-box protein [Candidatus Aminicenantes bacterium]|nr:PAS domain S-box protein [Candidatus Aminicenantes bacterium]MDH5705758.1 PAS domain S-box protein [Candidatus Aminicenantes bacterium]